MLEGGYDLPALAASVRATLEVLTGRREDFPHGPAGHDAARARQRARGAARRGARGAEELMAETPHPDPLPAGGQGTRGGPHLTPRRRWRARGGQKDPLPASMVVRVGAGGRDAVCPGAGAGLAGRLAVAGRAGARADRQPRPAARRGLHRGGARPARRVAAGPADVRVVVPLRRRAVRRDRAGRRAVARRAARRRAPRSASRCRRCSIFATSRSTARLPVVPVGQPAARVRLAGRVPAAPTRPAPARALPVPAAAVQALLRVRHRQVAVAAARLARRQRDDLLLRDRAAADRGSPGTRTTCPSGGTTSRAGRRWCWSWSSPSAIFGPRRLRLFAARRVHAVPDRQRRHRQLRLLLLPGASRCASSCSTTRDVERGAGPPRARRALVPRARAASARALAALRRKLPRPRAARPAAAPRPAMGSPWPARLRSRSSRWPTRSCTSASRARRWSFVTPLLRAQLDASAWSNTYHLFASITRERIEPEFQTLADGPVEEREADDAAWTAQHLRHKPGDVTRAPRLRRAPPAARRLPALVLRPRLPAPPARLRRRRCSSACARTRRRCSRCFARRCPRSRLPSASCSGSISSPAPPRSAPPAPGGDGRASRPCARYPAPELRVDPSR